MRDTTYDLGCAGWPHSANDFAAAEQRDEAPREVPPPPVAPPPPAFARCGRCDGGGVVPSHSDITGHRAFCPACHGSGRLRDRRGVAPPSLASAVGAARFGGGGSRALPDSSVVDGHDANVRPRGAGDR